MTYNLRPSASGIWTKCAANPRISQNAKTIPQDSDPAREGTCAAWVGESVLLGQYPSCWDMVGLTHENGWLVNEEMAYYVQGYVDTIRGNGGTIHAEQHVRLTDNIAGTFDSSSVSSDGTTLRVDDLKYGYKWVDVYELPQLIIYGYAEYSRLNNPNITHVVLGIYQPRAWHPEGIYRTWRLTVQELYEKACEIAAKGEECQNPNALASPGSHCEYCKGRLECAALTAVNYMNVESIREGRQAPVTPEELSRELDFLDLAEDMLKARKTAITAEAEQRIKNGETVRGWGLKERRGHRKFTVDTAVVAALTGIEPFKKVEKTPAEMEKDGADKNTVNKLSRTHVIGHKLDRFTDKDIGRIFRDR